MSNDRDDRAARLAEQLRANLRKRKQQARAASDPAAAASNPAGGEAKEPAGD